MAIKVYTSAKLAHAKRLREMQPNDFHFNARWLWMAESQRKNLKPVSHWKEENRNDIVSAHFFLNFLLPSDDLSGSIEEIGYAIGKGKLVWIAGDAPDINDEHWGVEVEVPGMAPVKRKKKDAAPDDESDAAYETVPGTLRIPHKGLVPWGFDRPHIRMVPNIETALFQMRQIAKQERILNSSGEALPNFEFAQ